MDLHPCGLEMLQVGNVLQQRYRLVSFLGEGGMGSAWAGEDLATRNLVVVKCPKLTNNPEMDKVNAEKLQVEIDVVKLLHHQHLVQFVDAFYVENAVPLLVTNFATGNLMEKSVSGYPASESDAMTCMKDLLDATQYIHSLNIIHRDIRPKNVIIPQRDFAKSTLIDFGTAKFFYRQVDTPEGIISPGGYSPPEHYRLTYSPQGDIWSLGGTLFFLITGQHPLLALGDYPNNARPPDPREINPKVSERVSKVIIKAMQISPSNRYVSPEEMKNVSLRNKATRTNASCSNHQK